MGRATIVVVDCGGGGTSVAPVIDGYVLRKPIQRSHRGGDWTTDQVGQFLTKQVPAIFGSFNAYPYPALV